MIYLRIILGLFFGLCTVASLMMIGESWAQDHPQDPDPYLRIIIFSLLLWATIAL